MTQFNYHHLYYFKVIATEGSISKAADRLRLGQPTLSMQLKQFEDFLGHKLFDRKNRTLVLTEMGRMVLHYANEIFRLGQEMMDSVHDRPTKKRLRLQIGALDGIPKAVIRSIMSKAFSMGDVQITVIEGESVELMEELINHRVDLIFSNSQTATVGGEKVLSRVIGKFPLVVCGSEKFSELKQNFPKSLAGQPFILPTAHSKVRHDCEHFFDRHRLMIDLVAETQDTSLMKALGQEGRGLIVTSELAVTEMLKAGALIKLGDLDGYEEELWMIAIQRKLPNPIAENLFKAEKLLSF